jgi:RNA polymerase sigma-B factor
VHRPRPAANKFDPDKSHDFLTYAVPTIRGEVKRYFRDHSWAVRPPRRIQEVQALIQRSGVAFGLEGNRQELAARLGLDETEVEAALLAQGCADLGAAEARTMLRALVDELSPRDRLVLHLRFFECRRQKEIGEEIGVTQMQVSRLISRILTRMRNQLEGGQAGDWVGA